MDTKEILAQIDTEIARLQQVRDILSGTSTVKTKLGNPKSGKRNLSPEARARIAAAQKARWAKAKKAAKKTA